MFARGGHPLVLCVCSYGSSDLKVRMGHLNGNYVSGKKTGKGCLNLLIFMIGTELVKASKMFYFIFGYIFLISIQYSKN